MKQDWPRIKKKAADLRAYIAFIDESGLLMAPLVRRIWSERGHSPTIVHKGAGNRGREKVSVAATIWLSPHRDHLGALQRFPVINIFLDFSREDVFFQKTFPRSDVSSHFL